MSLADDFNSMAVDLMASFGKPLTLRSIIAGAFNTATNSTTNTTADYECTGSIVAYSDRLVDGISILKTDRKCTIQASGLVVAPLVGWQVAAEDGIFFSILDVARKEVNGTSIVWVCQIRHGAQ